MKQLTIGILAHVDAGKTTCIESMLYVNGDIREAGRVDHRNAFLDFDKEEKDHGITIYAKEAHLKRKDTMIHIIDTPGHVDFSSEMERTLQVLDAAVMIINGQDGVQSHTETIWRCLAQYHIPVILFVNKMDISYIPREELLENLHLYCSPDILEYAGTDDETLAMISDALLEEYTETRKISPESVTRAILSREYFPCIFGSALRHQGTEELLDLLASLGQDKKYPEAFGAKVYKISEDEQGNRLTHVKITGGILKNRQIVAENEKVDQIRIYQGRTYRMAEEVSAGMTCVLKGLTNIQAGQGLGIEPDSHQPLLKPYMNYQMLYPENTDMQKLLRTCRKLAEQDPELNLEINQRTGKIDVQLMGAMQMEILQNKIYDQCGIRVSFGQGRIYYLETIRNPVYGAGHFEPLRHYAEVHVRLEPLPAGSGLEITSECSTDILSVPWQKSILSALTESRQIGVLTGSELTDLRIVLVSGKGHIKHTEGGDFREAANRAVRQGLMKAESILLEPYEQFLYILPAEYLSRALYELETMHCTVKTEENEHGMMIIRGMGPVRLLMNYPMEIVTYTKGKGVFNAWPCGYYPCEDQEEIIAEIGYDSSRDLFHTSGSVFCSHGTGYTVPWNEADNHMHVQMRAAGKGQYSRQTYHVSEEEMNTVLEKATGNNRNHDKQPRQNKIQELPEYVQIEENKPKCLLIDGYNMIFSWDELKETAEEDIGIARDQLIDLVFAYQGFLKQKMILVFDGYKVKDNPGTEITRGEDFTIVYTRSNMTADEYLERITRKLQKDYQITVVSSDGLIQNTIFSHGALRMSSREFIQMIELSRKIF
ncbi:MAG: TetM/TetW/TetO/TetS family tetracycline resistance ribosomal protection protein [Solobacterium sp.]|nr:TetM/TetW/TetO/TetS family tetracycline resistance ribosomal protection protein [Solobacterium sp.]